MFWAVVAMAVAAALYMVVREAYVAPYCCNRCHQPTPFDELNSHAGYCRQCWQHNQ